jgi:hypothetical protein
VTFAPDWCTLRAQLFDPEEGVVFRLAAVVVVLVLAVVVGVLTAWQWGVLILFGAIFLVGVGYLAGVEIDATTRWGRAVGGDDPEDEGHWSRPR